MNNVYIHNLFQFKQNRDVTKQKDAWSVKSEVNAMFNSRTSIPSIGKTLFKKTKISCQIPVSGKPTSTEIDTFTILTWKRSDLFIYLLLLNKPKKGESNFLNSSNNFWNKLLLLFLLLLKHNLPLYGSLCRARLHVSSTYQRVSLAFIPSWLSPSSVSIHLLKP